MTEIEITTQRFEITEVFDHFVTGFLVKKGEYIMKYATNYDPHKGEVIFTLYVKQCKPE
jgi:hypothetical protein